MLQEQTNAERTFIKNASVNDKQDIDWVNLSLDPRIFWKIPYQQTNKVKIRGRCWQHPKMGLLNEVVLVKKGGSFPRVTIIPWK